VSLPGPYCTSVPVLTNGLRNPTPEQPPAAGKQTSNAMDNARIDRTTLKLLVMLTVTTWRT
jgi:hypothetical protein